MVRPRLSHYQNAKATSSERRITCSYLALAPSTGTSMETLKATPPKVSTKNANSAATTP